MTTLTKQDVRAVVKEDVPQIIKEEVPPMIQELVPPIIQELVPPIVRAETDDIRAEVARLGVLYEESSHILRGMSVSLDAALAQKSTVDDHQTRITTLEHKTDDIKKVVAHHSRQISSLKEREN